MQWLIQLVSEGYPELELLLVSCNINKQFSRLFNYSLIFTITYIYQVIIIISGYATFGDKEP